MAPRAIRSVGRALECPNPTLLCPVPNTSETFAARVFHYTDFEGDCWQWMGTTDDLGYGVICRGRRGTGNMPAHRAMYELLVGSVRADLQMDHLCRNHGCVNPDHLEPVTAEVNKRRGYGIARQHRMREKCGYGHPLDGITKPKGKKPHRYCKTCARQKSSYARYLAKKQAAELRRAA